MYIDPEAERRNDAYSTNALSQSRKGIPVHSCLTSSWIEIPDRCWVQTRSSTSKHPKHSSDGLGVRCTAREETGDVFDSFGNKLEIRSEFERRGEIAEFDCVEMPVQERIAQCGEMLGCNDQKSPVAVDGDGSRLARLCEALSVGWHRWSDCFAERFAGLRSLEELM